MKKFFAVLKREYIQRVRTKFFVIATILGPLLMAGFTVVPAMMLGMKSGGPMRLAIVDQTGKMYERVSKEIISGRAKSDDEDEQPSPNPNPQAKPKPDQGNMFRGSYLIEEVKLNGRPLDEVRTELDNKVQNRDLDGFIILPPDILKSGKGEFRARNAADVFTNGYLAGSVSRAVRGQRLVEAKIDEHAVESASEPVELKTTGAGGKESRGEVSFYFVFGVGFLIYMSVLLYGQFVLGAVIEEKETRIAEILFSSIKPFPLMLGKLVGVSLVALTQLGIWATAFLALSAWAAVSGPFTLPHVPPLLFVYFVLFFLLGYFLYATVYAVVGSMVTTTQEGSQLAMPVVLMLIAGLYLSFNIIRSPNSSLAFWASMFPFFAPITMLVRIVTETPPLWQILMSLTIGVVTVIVLVWVASRIYRVGMLMTGKKATIPEVWRWLRQT